MRIGTGMAENMSLSAALSRAPTSLAVPVSMTRPRRVAQGQPGLVLDCSAPKVDVGKFMANETRFRMLDKTNPERAKMLLELAREQAASRWAVYENLARGVDPAAAVAAAQPAPKA